MLFFGQIGRCPKGEEMKKIIALCVFMVAVGTSFVVASGSDFPPYIPHLDGVPRESREVVLDCEKLTGDVKDRLKLSFDYGYCVSSIDACAYEEGDCILFQKDREPVLDWVEIKVLHRSRYLYVEEITVTRKCKDESAFFVKSLVTEAVYPDSRSPTGYAYMVKVEQLAPPTPVAEGSLSAPAEQPTLDTNGDGKVDILDFANRRSRSDISDVNQDGRVDIRDFIKQAPRASGKIASTWGKLKVR